jgi:hypothetical protein
VNAGAEAFSHVALLEFRATKETPLDWRNALKTISICSLGLNSCFNLSDARDAFKDGKDDTNDLHKARRFL